MQNFDHNIGFWEKRQFFRRKLSKIAENCDHNIDPWSTWPENLFYNIGSANINWSSFAAWLRFESVGILEILRATLEEACLEKWEKFFPAEPHPILRSGERFCRPLKNCSFEVGRLSRVEISQFLQGVFHQKYLPDQCPFRPPFSHNWIPPNQTLEPNTYISGRKKKSSSQDCWPGPIYI
jgi:hypothetical protein